MITRNFTKDIECLDGEIWAELYCTYYISSCGRILSIDYKRTGKIRIMKPALDHKGYLRTMLKQKDGRYKTVKIHRLVCETFNPNPYNKPQVNHKNCVRYDNNYNNLEWATPQENSDWCVKLNRTYKNGLGEFLPLLRGEDNYKSKLTENEVLEIRSKFKPRKYTREMLSIEYNVSPGTIKDVILRKSWRHI